MNTHNANSSNSQKPLSKTEGIREVLQLWGLTEDEKLRAVMLICRGGNTNEVVRIMTEMRDLLGCLLSMELDAK